MICVHVHVGIVCIIMRICMCVGEGEAIISSGALSCDDLTKKFLLKIRLCKWHNQWRFIIVGSFKIIIVGWIAIISLRA